MSTPKKIKATIQGDFKEICEADGVAMSDRLEKFILRMVERRAGKH